MKKKKKKHDGKIINIKDGFKIIECSNCGFKHTDPLLSDDKVRNFYGSDYYAKERKNYFKDAEDDMEWWNLTYDNYYDFFEKYTKGKQLIDIGSGPGYFLKRGKERGYEVLGYEPSKDAAEYSRGLGVQVVNDFFSEDSRPQKKFDVVNLSFVIEHLLDPVSLIKSVKKIMKDGAVFCIICPNDFNSFQNVLWKDLDFSPWWIVPTQHINYFSFESLRKLLFRLGFEVVESLSTFPMEYFLLSGQNYIDNRSVGRKCHVQRKEFEKKMYKYARNNMNDIYRSMALHNVGREIVVIAKLKK